MLQDIYTNSFNTFELDLTHYYNAQDYTKENYTALDRTPFTYLIGWSETNMYYYGVKWEKRCLPTNLFTTYFTSSVYVTRYIEGHGQPDIIIIDKVFDTSKTARDYEVSFLNFYDAKNHKNFLNKSNGYLDFYTSDFISEETRIKKRKSRKGFKHSEETKLKISLSGKGKKKPPITDSHKHKLSLARTGKKHSIETKLLLGEQSRGRKKSPETIKKFADATRGKKRTDECKARMSEAAKNKKSEIKVCEYCNKEVVVCHYTRYHGDNCKYNPLSNSLILTASEIEKLKNLKDITSLKSNCSNSCCVEGVIYTSVRIASKATGISPNRVADIINSGLLDNWYYL